MISQELKTRLWDEDVDVICILPLDLGEGSGGDALIDFCEDFVTYIDWDAKTTNWIGLPEQTVKWMKQALSERNMTSDGKVDELKTILKDLGGFVVTLHARVYERWADGSDRYSSTCASIEQHLYLADLNTLGDRLTTLLDDPEFQKLVRREPEVTQETCDIILYAGLGEEAVCGKSAIGILDKGKPSQAFVCEECLEDVNRDRVTLIGQEVTDADG